MWPAGLQAHSGLAMGRPCFPAVLMGSRLVDSKEGPPGSITVAGCTHVHVGPPITTLQHGRQPAVAGMTNLGCQNSHRGKCVLVTQLWQRAVCAARSEQPGCFGLCCWPHLFGHSLYGLCKVIGLQLSQIRVYHTITTCGGPCSSGSCTTLLETTQGHLCSVFDPVHTALPTSAATSPSIITMPRQSSHCTMPNLAGLNLTSPTHPVRPASAAQLPATSSSAPGTPPPPASPQ
jgi:hypothetical protein